MSVQQVTLNSLRVEINALKKQNSAIVNELEEMQEDINNRVKLSDLATSEQLLDNKIKTNASNISKNDAKLGQVILPEETRYYLSKGEVETFQNNFNKLLAMMTQFEQLYKNLVAYSAKLSE